MKKLLALSLHLLITSFLFAQNLPSYLPSNGLVAWYPFNGNANDESGNGRNGIVNGALLSTDRFGNSNSAYSFDGNGTNISASCNGFSTNQRTLSFWFYANDIGVGNSGRAILGYGGNGTCGTSCLVVIDNAAAGGNKYEISGHCNNEGVYYDYGQNHPNNNWYHWMIVNNPTDGTSFYLNGQLVSNSTLYIQQTYTNNKNIYFGTGVNWNGNSSFWDSNVMPFNGLLDDIAIWNRALTQEEITALYTGTPVNGGGGSTSTSNPVPPGIPYQAVVRNANGGIAANTAVTTRFTLHQATADGAVEYQETHALTTNAQGLMAAVLGQGTAVQNTFSAINWANTTKFLQVEVDLGNGYVDLGTQQLMSVPYSIQSQTALTIRNTDLPVYANNAAALAGGLTTGQLYRTSTGDLKIVY